MPPAGPDAECPLLRMTHHFQCLAGLLSGDIDGITIFKALARLEIRHALSRIGDAYVSSEMTLLANAVPRGPPQFRWIENRPRHGLLGESHPARGNDRRRCFPPGRPAFDSDSEYTEPVVTFPNGGAGTPA